MASPARRSALVPYEIGRVGWAKALPKGGRFAKALWRVALQTDQLEDTASLVPREILKAHEVPNLWRVPVLKGIAPPRVPDPESSKAPGWHGDALPRYRFKVAHPGRSVPSDSPSPSTPWKNRSGGTRCHFAFTLAPGESGLHWKVEHRKRGKVLLHDLTIPDHPKKAKPG